MNYSIKKKSSTFLLIIFVLGSVIMLGIFQDALHSTVNQYSFYFSESALYNSYWIFFIPIIWLQSRLINKLKGFEIIKITVVTAVLSICHLLAYAFTVNIVSSIAFPHTFWFTRVFDYAISNLLIISILLYGIAAIFIQFGNKIKTATKSVQVLENMEVYNNIPVISGGKTILIDPLSILYISSEKPYVAIHTSEKRLLHSGTLIAMEKCLNPEKFYRIHKSTIVNIKAITTLKSRGNGDYDLELQNGATVRMSRNYAETIKCLLRVHPLGQ